MRLDEMQRLVADAVRSETPVGDGHAPPLAGAVDLAAGNARLTPAQQIEIYREQFWLRHVASLLEDFPTLQHFLGEAGFRALACAYLRAHPPRTFSLRDLGADLPSFLRTDPRYAGDALLADCAATEWAFIEAYDGPDAPPLDPRAIAAIPEDAWTEAVLVLHPALQRVALGFPAHETRARVRAGEQVDRPAPRGVTLAIFRSGEALQYVELEPLAFGLLAALARGVPLGRACDTVAGEAHAGSADEIEGRLAGWFQSWAAYGWIAEVRVA